MQVRALRAIVEVQPIDHLLISGIWHKRTLEEDIVFNLDDETIIFSSVGSAVFCEASSVSAVSIGRPYSLGTVG